VSRAPARRARVRGPAKVGSVQGPKGAGHPKKKKKKPPPHGSNVAGGHTDRGKGLRPSTVGSRVIGGNGKQGRDSEKKISIMNIKIMSGVTPSPKIGVWVKRKNTLAFRKRKKSILSKRSETGKKREDKEQESNCQEKGRRASRKSPTRQSSAIFV